MLDIRRDVGTARGMERTMAVPKRMRGRQLAIVTSLVLSNCLLVAFVSGLALTHALAWPSGVIAWLHQASS
jgi:hypothetical protein